MKFNNQLSTIVKNALEENIVIMLLGEPGIGKSSWIKNLAKELNTEVFTLACNQLGDKTDLTGARLVPYKDTFMQRFYPHIKITKAIEYAKEHPDETPVLFLDEINRTSEDITSALLSIPTDRSIGDVDLPENLKVILAGNEHGNVNQLDEASISRFFLIRIEPDPITFKDKNKNLHPIIEKVIRELGTVFAKKDTNNLFDTAFNQFSTPRTLDNLSKWLNKTSIENLILFSETSEFEGLSVLEGIVEGFIGKNKIAEQIKTELNTWLEEEKKKRLSSFDADTLNDNYELADWNVFIKPYVSNISELKELSGEIVEAVNSEEASAEEINTLVKQTIAKLKDKPFEQVYFVLETIEQFNNSSYLLKSEDGIIKKSILDKILGVMTDKGFDIKSVLDNTENLEFAVSYYDMIEHYPILKKTSIKKSEIIHGLNENMI